MNVSTTKVETSAVTAMIGMLAAGEISSGDAKALELTARLLAPLACGQDAAAPRGGTLKQVVQLPKNLDEAYYQRVADLLEPTGIRLSLAVVHDYRANEERVRAVFAYTGRSEAMMETLCQEDGNWRGRVLKTYTPEPVTA